MESAKRSTIAAAILLLTRATAMITPSSWGSFVSQARVAIQLTERANIDPSYATEACKLWPSILKKNTNGICALPLDALPAAHALYACALTRIGRDKDAVLEYQTSLEFLEKCQTQPSDTSSTEIEIRMGLGKSLQRLLHYYKAKSVFLETASRCMDLGLPEPLYPYYAEAAKRAALCCVRLGEVDSAINVINQFEKTTKVKVQEPEIAGMKGVLLLLNSTSTLNRAKADCLLSYASKNNVSILYKWVHYAMQHTQTQSHPFMILNSNNEDITQWLAEINNSAFDDPYLHFLDDKILLHTTVLKSIDESIKFYPEGFVLPGEISMFQDHCKEFSIDGGVWEKRRWMLKDRSGYGSHGNRITSAKDVTAMYINARSDESVLCQHIVHPPMLIDGRKFSLRIYVVYFPKGISLSMDDVHMEAEVYLSTQGLVKFASDEFVDDDIGSTYPIENQYMTNSGRGDGRSASQHDLTFLRNVLEKKDSLSYNKLWKQIQTVVQRVMGRYISLRCDGSLTAHDGGDSGCITVKKSNSQPPQCLPCIPKILGFDFMMDTSEKPWLLEVNRFPGLRPRSSMDTTVKQCVLYDAWLAAADRIGYQKEMMYAIRPLDYTSFSLIKIKPE